MVATGIVALYFGAVRPYEAAIGINNSKATGLAGAQSEPLGLWQQMRYLPQYNAQDQDHVGGVPGGLSHGRVGQMEVTSASLAAAPPPAPSTEDRKIVRTTSLDLIVKKPGDVAEKIRALCERAGGFLVNSTIRGDQEMSGGSLTIRVPAARFDEVRTQIRKLGLRVENEKIEAEDVTRQYVD